MTRHRDKDNPEMMSSEQPEHCEHECKCFVYLGMMESTEKEPCVCNICEDNTRSRPHPAPARTAEHMQSAYAHGVMDGARKAREKVLQQVIDYCNKEAKENPDDEVWYDSTMEKVADYCESLRAQQAGEPLIPAFTLGKTTIGQISRKELAEIRERLKTTPKRTLKELQQRAGEQHE